MRSAAQRIDKFNARMVSSQIDPVLSAINALAKANFASYAIEFVDKQTDLRTFMNLKGYDPASFFNYEGFNGEMYHVWKTCTDASAVSAATSLVIKWKLYGCVEADLKALCASLYNIIVP